VVVRPSLHDPASLGQAQRLAAGRAHLGATAKHDRRPPDRLTATEIQSCLLSLIEELLDYSKIEAGKIDLEHRPFALAALAWFIAARLYHRERLAISG